MEEYEKKRNKSAENCQKNKIRERSRENSIKKNKPNKHSELIKKINPFIYSNEDFKNTTILINESDISNFQDSEDLTLFEKREKAKILMKQRKTNETINLENILYYDNTNVEAQHEYLKVAVDILSKEKEEKTKYILHEKIQKASIILQEQVYNKEILKLNSEEKINLKYINYKQVLMNILGLIKDKDIRTNITELIDTFQLKKIFRFNQESIIGESNYYFYTLVEQLYSENLYKISYNINLYKGFIEKTINFLKDTDFSNLVDIQIDYFEYLINILVDDKFVQNYAQKKQIENYLETLELKIEKEKKKKMIIENENELKEEKNIKKVQDNKDNNELYEKIKIAVNNLNNNIKQTSNIVKYLFGTYKNNIFVDITDDRPLSRENFNMKKTYFYDINIFNEGILNILKNEFSSHNYHCFEYLFFQNINHGKEEAFFQTFKDKFIEILKKILKSRAAKDFFKQHYQSKYKHLKYHFNRESVINEIIKRIKFIPIFKNVEQAYTSPFEMKVYITSIPGKYNDSDIRIFERNILQLSRLIIIAIHEIFGHLMRRYYYFLSNGLVKFNTKDDDVINTKTEGGRFIEKNFLGLFSDNTISLKESLFILSQEYNSFPIIKTYDFTKNQLKKIVDINKDYFNFIDDGNNNLKKDDKISLESLEYYLLGGYTTTNRISCGGRKENCIYLY